MKKFILLIAIITLSFGSVWAETYSALSKSTSATDSNIPFSVNCTTQHIQMIYPASKFQGTFTYSNGYKVDFIRSLTFTSNNQFTFGDNNYMFKSTTTDNVTTYSLNTNCTIAVTISEVTNTTTLSTSGFITTGLTNSLTTTNVTVPSDRTIKVTLADENVQKWDYTNHNNNVLIDIVISCSNDFTLTSYNQNWNVNNDPTSAGSSTKPITAIYQQNNGTITSSTSLPELSINCSRKISNYRANMKNNFYECDIYSYCDDGSAFKTNSYAILNECQLYDAGCLGFYYIYPSSSNNPDTTTDINSLLKKHVYVMEPTISCQLDRNNPDNVTITKFANSFTNNFNRTYSTTVGLKQEQLNNLAIVIPSSVEQIGTDSTTANNCFQTLNGNMIIFSSSNNTSISSFVGSNTSQVDTNKNTAFRVYDNCSFNLKSNDSSWKTLLNSKTTGWCSHPFIVNIGYAYAASSELTIDKNSTNSFAYFTQAPFNTTPLKIQLNTTKKDPNSDGTSHYYYKFTDAGCSHNQVESNVTKSIENESIYVTTFKDATIFTLHPNYYAALTADDAQPNYKDNDGNIAAADLFKSYCDYLIFEHSNDPSKSPKWYYKGANDAGTDAAIDVNTEVRVVHEINSLDFEYFSMPFMCTVSDISVKNKDGGAEIPFYSGTVTNANRHETTDYFVIFEYSKQDSSGNKAQYTKITDSDYVLTYNKGYAIAIFESKTNKNSNIKVCGEIVFKSKKTDPNKFGSIAYDGFTLTGMDYNESQPERNRGWNMVGNPFYFPINCSSYGNYKYIAVIDHQNKDKKVKHIRTDIGSQVMQPFEVAFIQVKNNENITIHPSTSTQSSVMAKKRNGNPSRTRTSVNKGH